MWATRQRHADATRAPRRVHLSAAGRGAPAVAGGDSGHPSRRGRVRWKAESKGDLMVAAPLIIGRRSSGGEHFRGGRRSVRTDSTKSNANACDLGMGRELSSPGTRGAGRGGRRSDGDDGIDHGGARTGEEDDDEYGRSRPSRQVRASVEGKRRTAKRTAVSEQRGEAPVDGGGGSRRR